MSFRPEAVRGSAPTSTPRPGAVDYRLARRSLITEYRKGRIARHEVCDAHPELLRAARNVGDELSEQCPICEDAALVLVTYVFGPRLPRHGRCVADRKELAKLHRRKDELACYLVEVCPDCGWNHLAQAFPIGGGTTRR